MNGKMKSLPKPLVGMIDDIIQGTPLHKIRKAENVANRDHLIPLLIQYSKCLELQERYDDSGMRTLQRRVSAKQEELLCKFQGTRMFGT